MMEPNSPRPARKVAIADHIWEAFEEMAQQMGADREALINQAMFMFARLNGFLEVSGGQAVASPPVLARAPREEARAPAPLRRVSEPEPNRLDDDPVRREVQAKVLETADELERLINAKGEASQAGPAPEDLGDEPMDEPMDEPVDDAAAGPDIDEGYDDPGEEAAEEGPQLYLKMEGGEMDRVLKERFVIGRGKHCDFVINSGKVSREHALIVHENGEYFIEDLNSSNGTWFNKQRIKRRQIENGDEYFICSEKIKMVLR